VKTLIVTVEFVILVPDETKPDSIVMHIPTEEVFPQTIIEGKDREIPEVVVQNYCTVNVEAAEAGRV
jgi:hypothetical protein